jgi:hypothetical protein
VLGRGFGMTVITMAAEGKGEFMAGWVFSRASKMLLGGMVCLSFNWSLFTYSA